MLGQPETVIRAPYGLLASRALAWMMRQPENGKAAFQAALGVQNKAA